MVGLSLLAGGFAIAAVRWVLVGFLIASLAGLAVGPLVPMVDPLTFAAAVAACVLAALAPGQLAGLAVLVAVIGGYLIGEVSIPDDGPTRDRLITMSGSIVGANVGLLYLFGINTVIRERFTWPWIDIAFRVAAAWLGAIALLMFALGYVESPAAS
ncbi:hypothetical protein LCL97_12725 [Seohaeicola saemankumensis]|nr:hypothetical protein [Seohaeicola saemankumensis]MCA0871694.1 hypothetical protein [Seohaeicola saemankumensis]